MTYRQIDHVGIAVSDMDAAITRYKQLLGVAPSVRKVLERDGIEAAMLDLGSTHVELVAATRQDSAISRFLAKHGEGMHHVAYRVDDIHAALAEARDQGAQLLDAEPRIGVMGHLVAFIHPKATLGVLTELVQTEHPG